MSELFLIPRSFQAVVQLDLSQCWPWGNSLFQCLPGRAVLVGQVLKQAFPRVKNMTIYARDSRDIEVVACFWPEIQSLKLVRWHQRPVQPEESSGFGMEFQFLMQNCKALRDLDLSHFYCWTEDIPPALEAELSVSKNLRSLNLLKVSGEGFKALELEVITNNCTNLEELRVVVVFDPRFLDFVGDSALVQLATCCAKLRVLHLVDGPAFEEVRGDPNEGFSSQDAQIGSQGLVGLFERLPLLEDLALVLSQNVRDSGPALEKLASHCTRLRSLRLGHFHGLCRGLQPAGVALCSGLNELVIKNSADLNDTGLVAIASGCTGLRKLVLHSCKEISKVGCRALTNRLSGTLVDVEISCCLQMDAVDTLWALHPIQASIKHLHLDCIWDDDLIAKIQDEDDLIARELAKVHQSHTSPKLNVWESETREGIGSSLAKGFTIMDAAVRAKHCSTGKAKYELVESFKSSHTLDLNSNVPESQGDSGGQCSTSSTPMEKLKGNTCDGWLTLSMSSSAKDVLEGIPAISGAGKDCDTERDWSGGLGLDLMGAGTAEVLSGSSKSSVVSLIDPGALRLSLDRSGNETNCTTPRCLNGRGCERNTALGNGNPQNPVDESCMFTSGQECINSSGNTHVHDFCRSYREQAWSNLKSLSLWILVGEEVSLLPVVGLRTCPLLQEIRLKVEGDSRLCPKPRTPVCGVATFACYPALSKLMLDCSETIGYALSVPPGHMELGLWERWYLRGIQTLNLMGLEYWPPQDRDANRRGISLPSAGLISQCPSMRMLVIHGTLNEHFLHMFLNIPNLRDVLVKIDYYPAPEELNTEMRPDAFKRFEAKLTKRGYPD